VQRYSDDGLELLLGTGDTCANIILILIQQWAMDLNYKYNTTCRLSDSNKNRFCLVAVVDSSMMYDVSFPVPAFPSAPGTMIVITDDCFFDPQILEVN
jgi:hypothetical protein